MGLLFFSCEPRETPEPEQTKPTVTTGEVTSITTTTASCSGNVTDDGGAAVTARGVCWNTSQNPTTANSKTTDGSGKGTFTGNLENLTPNATYYIRTYATNAQGTAYGEQKSFTTKAGIPTVTTGDVTDITATTATCSGNVTADGGSPVTACGICVSTSQNPTTANQKSTFGPGLGPFVSKWTGFSPNTTYYVRAYATNAQGTAYGEQKSFTTTLGTPTVTTGDVIDITATTATCSGNVKNDGGSDVISRGICWNTSENPTVENAKTTNDTGLGAFTSYLTGLTPNVTYYVRAYAENAQGTAYGNQKTFKTAQGAVGETFTDSRDGNVYKTVTIGKQTWMAENMAYLPSVYGPEKEEYIQKSVCYVYGYNYTNVYSAKQTNEYKTYGVLYNYPAAGNIACPDGWHLPSSAEWTQLQNYLIANGYNYDGTRTGNKIALSMTIASGWDTSYDSSAGAVNRPYYPEYRNKSGFSALPGGGCWSPYFDYIGYAGIWWTSTSKENFIAEVRNLTATSKGLGSSYIGYYESGFSVRCVMD